LDHFEIPVWVLQNPQGASGQSGDCCSIVGQALPMDVPEPWKIHCEQIEVYHLKGEEKPSFF